MNLSTACNTPCGRRVLVPTPLVSLVLADSPVKKFKLLVLGGDHVYGYGVGIGQSFIEQLTRRLSDEGLSVSVESHAPMSLGAMIGLLPRLPLQQFDLIIVQPGHYELQRPALLTTLFTADKAPFAIPETACTDKHQPKPGPLKRRGDQAKVAGLGLIDLLVGIPWLHQVRHQLRTVLDELQPCGHNVVLVTPFPHHDTISGWLRQKGRRLFLEEGYRAFMPVFDAYSQLEAACDVCFLPTSQSHLNALGHELVGSALYDFFRAGVMVVGDSSSYRRHE